ncbi:MAG: lanthionine synthetase LanC family protein, partial [Gemmatimonadota bacterium]
MYSGRIGEAVFLAALYASTRNPRYCDTALAAAQPLRDRLRDSAYRGVLADEIGIGVGGLGSVVYALVLMADFLEQPQLLRDAERGTEAITSQHIDQDQAHDVVLGAAGALLGLLALYNATGAASVMAQAEHCAEHLLHCRVPDPETGLRAWSTIRPVLSAGFAHGGSGVAHALLRLHARNGDSILVDVALEAFEFERSLFRADILDWPESRHQ